MNAKTKELNAKVFPYIIDAINPDAYGVTAETNEQKLLFLADVFQCEYCFPDNLKRYKSLQNILANWIMGLPSVFNIDFENYRIIEIAYEWGSIEPGLSEKAKERAEQKILDNWFQFIAAKTFQLWNKYKISVQAAG